MSNNPDRGNSALRRGRHSAVGAEYFITCCTEARQPGLESALVAPRIIDVAHALCSEGFWTLRAAVVMPDHLHLLIALGDRATLPDAMRMFKGIASLSLREAGLHWQRGYFDHRMRDREDLLPVFLYIFLNPYRAALIKAEEKWPAYYCAEKDWAWFAPLTNESRPQPEWIR